MSIPFRKFAAIISRAVSAAFTRERNHAVLISADPHLPTKGVVEVSSVGEYTSRFGKGRTADYDFISRYFSYISSKGSAPKKICLARWAKTNVAAFVVADSAPEKVNVISSLPSGTFTITMNGSASTQSFSAAELTSYSDIASGLQALLRSNTAGGEAFTACVVSYDTSISRFVITNGTTGTSSTISLVADDTAGENLMNALGGLQNGENQGAALETYAAAIDRIYNLNPSGSVFVTAEDGLTGETDFVPAVEWVQGVDNNQARYGQVAVAIPVAGLSALNTLTNNIKDAGMDSGTGYFICETTAMPEFCGLIASVDYEAGDGVLSGNMQPCKFAQSITIYDNIVDAQQGNTNLSVAKQWDDKKATYAYDVGIGTQTQKVLGLGLEYGDFGTVMNQMNEINLVRDIQMTFVNAMISLGNVYLHGSSGDALLSSIIDPCFTRAVANGTIARGPTTLTDEDKTKLISIFGSDTAVKNIEKSGYHYVFWPRNAEDIANNQVRYTHAYQVGGSVYFLVGNSYLFK